jgi:type II secretory pathway pseudopilin PulG
MSKQLSLGNFKLSKANLSSIKLPKGISIAQVVLIVVGIILLALAIYFAISYFGAVSERELLNKSIQLTHQQITNTGGPQNISALQSQLEVAQQDLIDESPFPFEINSIEVTYLILQAAADANVACFQYNPAGSKGSFYINGHAYTDNRFSISSSGVGGTGYKITRIIKFLKNIEELPYNAVSIIGLSLSRVGDTQMWSVGFTLSILSQQ